MCSICKREVEARETWRAVDEAAAEAFKKTEFSEWDFGAGDLVKSSTKILRVTQSLCRIFPADLMSC